MPDLNEIRALFAPLVDTNDVTPLGTSLDYCVGFTHACVLLGVMDSERWKALTGTVADLGKSAH